MPKQEEKTRLQTIDICDTWRGLNPASAKEVAFWEHTFHICIQECLGRFVIGKFRGDPEWTSALQLGEFVNSELAQVVVPVDIDALVTRMLESCPYEEYAGGFLERSHHNLSSAVKLFLKTRQCWHLSEETMLTAAFESTWTSNHLEISATVLWQPPDVSLTEDRVKLLYTEPFLNQPSLRHSTKVDHRVSKDHQSTSGGKLLITTVIKSFANGIGLRRVLRTWVNNCDRYHTKPACTWNAEWSPRSTHRQDILSSDKGYFDDPNRDEHRPGGVPLSPSPCPPANAWTRVGQAGTEPARRRKEIGETDRNIPATCLPTHYSSLNDPVSADTLPRKERPEMLSNERMDTPMRNFGPTKIATPNHDHTSPCSDAATAAVKLTMRATKDLKKAMRLQARVCTGLRGGISGTCTHGFDGPRKPFPNHNCGGGKECGISVLGVATPPDETVTEARAAQDVQRMLDLEQARIKDNYDQFRTARGVKYTSYEGPADLFASWESLQASSSGGSRSSRVGEYCGSWSSDEYGRSEDERSHNDGHRDRRDSAITMSEDTQPLLKFSRSPKNRSNTSSRISTVLGGMQHNHQAFDSAKSYPTRTLRRALPLSGYGVQRPSYHTFQPDRERQLPRPRLPSSQQTSSCCAIGGLARIEGMLSRLDNPPKRQYAAHSLPLQHIHASHPDEQRSISSGSYAPFNSLIRSRVVSIGKKTTREHEAAKQRNLSPSLQKAQAWDPRRHLERARVLARHFQRTPPAFPALLSHYQVDESDIMDHGADFTASISPRQQSQERPMPPKATTQEHTGVPWNLPSEIIPEEALDRSFVIGDKTVEEGSQSPGTSPRHWRGKRVPFVELVRYFAKARLADEAHDRQQCEQGHCHEPGKENVRVLGGAITEVGDEQMSPKGKDEEDAGGSPHRRHVLCDRGNGTEADGVWCLGTDEFDTKD